DLNPAKAKLQLEELTEYIGAALPVIGNLKEYRRKLMPLEAQRQVKRSYLKRIKIEIGNKLWLLPVEDIICVKACGRYVKVVTDQKEALVSMSLKRLSEQLDPEVFWQVHRSTVINLAQLDHIHNLDSEQMQAHMKGLAEPVVISRKFASLFKTLYSN
ncbi:MAG: LytTR family transcriptional regulator, partial [Psychrosphaera sp.]|nr:LytTR family transcriptional regulator [Psychrosphaera sp.]